MPGWQVLGPEAEENKDTQNHPHPKVPGKGTFRSHGVNADLQIFSNPRSLFWGLSAKGECGQPAGTLPEKSDMWGKSTPSQGLGAGERGGWLEIQANCWRQIEAKGHCYEPSGGFTHTFNHSSQT